MAQRRFIERENLLTELKLNAENHAQTGREEVLLYRDRIIVNEQYTFTEQEIVRPYLEKLKSELTKNYVNLCDINNYTYTTVGLKSVLDAIDNLLTEGDLE